MSLPMPTYIPSSRPGQIAGLPWREVCPHCLTALTVHHFKTGDFFNETYHCRHHGDIPTPRRSAIWND